MTLLAHCLVVGVPAQEAKDQVKFPPQLEEVQSTLPNLPGEYSNHQATGISRWGGGYLLLFLVPMGHCATKNGTAMEPKSESMKRRLSGLVVRKVT